jgi:predicted GNAT family acetyltransferase
MNVALLDDPAVFLDRVRGFDEARNNLLLGLAGTLVADPAFYPEKRFWVVEDDGRVVGAALRTPPYNLVLGDAEDDAAIGALVDALRDEDLPGVVGLVPAVDTFARLWSHAPPALTMAQGVYALDRVADVPRPAGAARIANWSDRDLALEWWDAFVAEAVGADDAPVADRAEHNVDGRLEGTSRGLWLWEDNGAPVSMAGWGGETPNGIRVGPVYIPPELRGHGYATALVAERSQWLLDRGRRFCFLYTDLANPTSNKIYERIGYVRIAESRRLTFA